MKSFSIADARKDLESVLDEAQKGGALILRRGKPSAFVWGIEFYDEEDWQLMTDVGFWRMIAQRRKYSKLIPLAEVETRLFGKNGNGQAARTKNPAKKKRAPKRRTSRGVG